MKNSPAKRIVKGILKTVLVILVLGLAFGAYYINTLIPIITGYPAKYLCSAVFVSGREQAEVEAMDLNFSFIKYVKNEVNLNDSSVTSRFLWGKSKAIYRNGFGATLLRDVDETELRKIRFPEIQASFNPDTISWPLGNIMPDTTTTNVNKEELKQITSKLMNEDFYNGHAFAFMVLHKGIPVAEAYQPQFDAKTRFLSWSMAKSFTNTLAGMMVKDGKWDINQPINIPEWQNDDRKQITYKNLMQAESGLEWNEDYGNRSDVTVMLYCNKDFARFVFDRPLASAVGSTWVYSSGNPNVITYQIRQTIGNDQEYYKFPKTRLFDKIGMSDAVFEVDASGNFVGSSYVFASLRSYARYGLMLMNDGVFNGERILPEGWVSASVHPNAKSNGEYGSLFWLNQSGKLPSIPKDMFWCQGYDGQRLFMIPSKDLIVVVLGFSHKPDVMNTDKLLSDIISAVE